MRQVLVVGGGPVGLSAAFFLSKLGDVKVTIIDKKQKVDENVMSKALNINARTITLFHQSNIQKQILKLAYQVHYFKVYNADKTIINTDISHILKTKTPFSSIYILQQTITQQIIEKQLLETYNLPVQRGRQVLQVKNVGQKVEVIIRSAKGTVTQVYDMVLGADGAHSRLRNCLGLNFKGQTLKQKLYLCDVVISGPQLHQIQVYLQEHKRTILIPISPNIARIVGNCEDYLNIIQTKYKIQNVEWKNQFTINNRVIQHMRAGNVFFAGDAAHVHAPIGGRGMNMGIEDVFIFSYLLHNNKLDKYEKIRLPKIKSLVQKISTLSKRLLQNNGLMGRLIVPLIASILKNNIMNEMVSFAGGLDYDIPYLPRL